MRNTTAVKRALLDIRKAKPEAVVIVGAYKPSAAFITTARAINLDVVFVNISFVDAMALAKELGPSGAGVVVSQVVPFPDDTSIPIVASYRKALARIDPEAEPGFVSFEGYIAGRLVIEALSRIDGEPTREAFLATIRDTGTFNMGGVTLSYGPGDNQGMDEVFLTVLRPDGRFVAADAVPQKTGAPKNE